MSASDSSASRGPDFDDLTQQGEAAPRSFDPAASAGLFVGVSRFVDASGTPSAEFSPIPFAVDDAIDLAGLFALERKLINPKKVRLLLSGAPQKETSQTLLTELRAAGVRVDAATFVGVLDALESTASDASEAGLLVMSISTHGMTLEGERLLCLDSRRRKLTHTSLDWNTVQRELTASACPRRLLLIDACREQVAPSRSVGAEANHLAEALSRVEGLAVLCAAPPRGFSFDDPERENGVFTARVLEGLRTGAPSNNEGLVTLQSLAVWVDSQVVAWVRANKPHLSSAQGITLRLEPQGIGNLPLAQRAGATPAQSSLPMVLVNPLADLDDYLKAAVDLHRSLPLIGVNPELRLTLGVDEVYVPLKGRLNRALRHENRWKGGAPDGEASSEGDIDLSEVFSHARGSRGIVVLGDPGSGKTTLLKLLLVRCVKQGGAALGLPEGVVPVLLPLRSLKLDEDVDLDAFFSRIMNETTHLGLPPGFLKAVRKAHPVLYLLDGLDEVADTGERGKVAQWILNGLKSHTEATIVVTCRFAGYQGEARLDDHFAELEIRGLKRSEAEKLVTNFYGVVERGRAEASARETGVDPDGPEGQSRAARAQEEARKKSAHLWSLLSSEQMRTRRMGELQVNPLLLTIVCLVHERYNDLPDKRWRLYEQCVDTLLWHWRKAVNLSMPFELDEARRLLLPLARWLHQQEKRRDATADEVAEALKGPLEALGLSEARLKQFLRDIRDRSGLLVGYGPDRYGFMHLALQEYLAAVELKNRGYGSGGLVVARRKWGGRWWQRLVAWVLSKLVVQPEDPLEEAARHFGESWWTEVILLLVSLPEPPLFEPLMRRVMKGDRFALPEHRGLLADCVADASQKSAVPFLEVLGDRRRSEAVQLAALWALRAMKEVQTEQVIRGVKALLSSSNEALRGQAVELLLERGVKVEQVLQAGTQWVHKATGLEFVYVPPGRFRMGSNDYDDGKPIHEVEFKRGFWIGKYPVTNAQYGQFMAETQHREPSEWQNRKFNSPEQPVVGVDWHDAVAFTRWADALLKQQATERPPDGSGRVALPSEAQWEYAARGPESRKYPWGEGDPTPELANFNLKVGRTTPVGQYPKGASWVGALDLAGNVWEWCLDSYAPYNDNDKVTAVDPIVFIADSSRVLRGGAWDSGTGWLRGADRDWYGPGYRDDILGFRVVCVSVSAEHGLDLDP